MDRTVVILVSLLFGGTCLFSELTQDKHYWFRIVIILISLPIGIYYLFSYLIESAPERAAKREEERENARIEAERIVQKKAEMIELQKQQKRDEYARRVQLRTEIEKMPKYSTWKNEVFEKCGRKCEMCGETNELEIHHRDSFDSMLKAFEINKAKDAFECNALWRVDNGSVLCKKCHEKMESSVYRNKATIQD